MRKRTPARPFSGTPGISGKGALSWVGIESRTPLCKATNAGRFRGDAFFPGSWRKEESIGGALAGPGFQTGNLAGRS